MILSNQKYKIIFQHVLEHIPLETHQLVEPDSHQDYFLYFPLSEATRSETRCAIFGTSND